MELSVMIARIFTCTLLGFCLFCGISDILAWPAAAGAAALAAVSLAVTFWQDRSPENGDAPEISAILEAAAVCFVLGSLKMGDTLGFLAVFPILLRADALKRTLWRSAGVLTLLVLLTGWAEQPNLIPPPAVLVQAAAVGTAIWMVLFDRNRGASVGLEPAGEPQSEPSATALDALQLLQVREEYRRAKSDVMSLERRTRSDRLKAALLDWRLSEKPTAKRLTACLHETLGTAGLALYGVPDSRRGFFCADSAGTVPATAALLQVQLHASPISIREQADSALKRLAGSEGLPLASALLIHKGRVAGLVALYDDQPTALDSARLTLEETSAVIAACMLESRDQESLVMRVKEAEIVSEFAQRASGRIGEEEALSVVSDIVEFLGVDGCTITDFAGDRPTVIAQSGPDPLDIMSFGSMNGALGWLRAGARETVCPDARADERFDKSAVLRSGIGSVITLPLISSGSLAGLITVWTKESNTLGVWAVRLMRSLAPIAVKRIFGGFASVRSGLIDPATFWDLSQGPGCFVEVDLGHSEPDQADALRTARRRMLKAVMTRLPEGGLVTRRTTGTLLVFLTGTDEARATRWAQALQPYLAREFSMKVAALGNSDAVGRSA